MPSPFPGMDPYLEDPGLWPDVHNSFIVVAREFLQRELRPKYFVRIEERVYISEEDDPGRDFLIPDIRIGERAGHKRTRHVRKGRREILIDEPEVLTTLLDKEFHEPYLGIMDKNDHSFVTIIEVTSPTNKISGSAGRMSYQKKKADTLCSPTHWMEIDLLRTGVPVVPRLAKPYDYVVHLSRADQRPRGHVWRIPLESRLPVVCVPLKQGDEDAPLDLQEVLQTTYDRAGYDVLVDYSRAPSVPLTREQTRWANQLLRAKGLR